MKTSGHYTIPVRTATQVLAVINLYTDTDVDASERTLAYFAAIGFQLGAGFHRLAGVPAGANESFDFAPS